MKKFVTALSLTMLIFGLGCKNQTGSGSYSASTERELPEGASQNTENNYNSASPEAENGPVGGQQGPHGTNAWFFNGKNKD
jgi:hypothetical protein